MTQLDLVRLRKSARESVEELQNGVTEGFEFGRTNPVKTLEACERIGTRDRDGFECPVIEDGESGRTPEGRFLLTPFPERVKDHLFPCGEDPVRRRGGGRLARPSHRWGCVRMTGP